MNILLLDLDTLRPDHLGCYGYQRNTSPNIDMVARRGMCFDQYYCSDAPCLPSRAALVTGQFGIHNGVTGHGGTAADRRIDGPQRAMQDRNGKYNIPALLLAHGYHTVSFSSFPQRHGAWWFLAGFQEWYNPGGNGHETADKVIPFVTNWLDRQTADSGRSPKNWFMHVHLWDAHAPARSPETFGEPFENIPLADPWLDDDALQFQLQNSCGAHSPMEVPGYTDRTNSKNNRMTARITCVKDFKHVIDEYDTGIAYADHWIGILFDKMKALNIWDDTAIIITADHGEDLGELASYCEHGMADYATTHIPMIIKWPGVKEGSRCSELHYNVDLLPTLADLLGGWKVPITMRVCGKGPDPLYDGTSFKATLMGEKQKGYEYLVVSQCAHVCQRSVRFQNWIYIRTYHDGYHLLDDEMLFDLRSDPHETKNVASEYPEVCWHAAWYLEKWYEEQMKKMSGQYFDDPMWRIISEGGPFHCKGYLAEYCERLEVTGRSDMAKKLRSEHPDDL